METAIAKLKISEEAFGTLFVQILRSAGKIQEFVGKEAFANSAPSIFKSLFAALVKMLFEIHLNCTESSNSGMWSEIENFYNSNRGNQILMLVWGGYLRLSTEKLANALKDKSNESTDLRGLAPFKGLEMKKEFMLQVLLDAFSCSESDYGKYEGVRNTPLYLKTFLPWMQLIKLIDVVDTSTDKQLLLQYIKSTL